MATYNIFYSSDKKIAWATFAPCDSTVIAQQAENNYSHLTIDRDEGLLLPIDKWYVNTAGDGILQYSEFNPTYSGGITGRPSFLYLGETWTITNLPEGATVYIDGTSKGTVPADGTVKLTGTHGGRFLFKLTLATYIDYEQTLAVGGRRPAGGWV